MTIKADVLQSMLKEAGFNPDDTDYLVSGFTDCFDLGYEGMEQHRDTSANIPFLVGNKFDMWEKIMKEVSMGRYAGPYESIPYDRYVQSPIGLVPKAGDKTRLIFHLSYDFKSGNKSINGCCPKSKCSVKYQDLDHAIRNSLNLLATMHNEKTGTIWYSKTDVQSAFRLVPT